MAILRLKLDVTKLDKSAFFKGAKGTYVDLTLFLNEDEDEYGNHGSLKQDLGKDRRDEKAPYCGNAKYIKRDEPKQPAKLPPPNPTSDKLDEDGEDDDIPF